MTVLPDEAGQRIDNYLLRELKGVPKSHVYRILRSGEVRVNSGRIDAAYRLADGDVIRIPPVRVAARPASARVRIPEGTTLKPHILFEDDAIIALAKPSGLAVHGGSGVSLGVIELLRREYSQLKFLELAHRLDRETSGILLVAKKRSALTGLHAALRDGGMEKHYLALAAGRWQGGRRHVKVSLRKFLTEDGERRVSPDAAGQVAHSIFTPQRQFQDAVLLDAEIRTGRTHQIRVHLAHEGHPILGDAKYGDFARNREVAKTGLKRMFLHAHTLALSHPISGERLELRCPLPADLSGYLSLLEKKEKAVAAI
ncbi:MAG: RluA family pseudouridine synthase [Burkholderiales bacterium]|nr:RluA family pseudouridine synthase [Burkholderiales bacterium]